MNYVLSLIKEMVKKRKLIWELSKADFKKRFVGSYFGVVWMLIQPIVTVLIYWFIFGPYGFKSAPPVPNSSYVEWLVPGIAPWFFFSEALNTGSNCLQEYNYLVKKVVFQVEILPVLKVVSSLFVHCFFVIIMFGMFLALAISYLTSAVTVFFKDMTQIVSICLQFGMWLVPIMWSPSMFPSAPAWLEQVLKINPVYYIVTGYRDSMLTGNWFWERPTLSLYFWAVTAVLMLIGLKVFKRLRPHFSDVL